MAVETRSGGASVDGRDAATPDVAPSHVALGAPVSDHVKIVYASHFDGQKRFVQLSKRSRTSYPKRTDTQVLRDLNAADARGATLVARAAYLVLSGAAPPKQVSRVSGIPRTTLRRAVIALKDHRPIEKVGRPLTLSLSAERTLFLWISDQIRANRDPTEEEVLEYATALRRKQEDDPHCLPVRTDWLKNFLARHPQLALRPVRCIEEAGKVF